jgi:hypothetical protein
MKRIIIFFLLAVLGVPAFAQLNGDGFYRVQNFQTNRYIILVDNKVNSVNFSATKADLGALRTIKPFSNVVSDPGSVYYIKSAGGQQYNLLSQGADAYAFAGRYLLVRKATNEPTYYAWGSSAGADVYLYDMPGSTTSGELMTGGDEFCRHWKILPVSSSGDNYFGLKPDVTVSGQHYSSLFASFGFTF